MTEERRQELLRTARAALEAIYTKKELKLGNGDERMGAFVTLRTASGELRGCIGYILPVLQLDSEIATLTRAAATEDYRFPPVAQNEIDSLTIEISLLTEPEEIADYHEIRLGTDGVILTKNSRRSVFLPQVATETGWDLDEFLSALSQKAGLPSDAYKQPDCSFQTFQAEVFSE